MSVVSKLNACHLWPFHSKVKNYEGNTIKLYKSANAILGMRSTCITMNIRCQVRHSFKTLGLSRPFELFRSEKQLILSCYNFLLIYIQVKTLPVCHFCYCPHCIFIMQHLMLHKFASITPLIAHNVCISPVVFVSLMLFLKPARIFWHDYLLATYRHAVLRIHWAVTIAILFNASWNWLFQQLTFLLVYLDNGYSMICYHTQTSHTIDYSRKVV